MAFIRPNTLGDLSGASTSRLSLDVDVDTQSHTGTLAPTRYRRNGDDNSTFSSTGYSISSVLGPSAPSLTANAYVPSALSGLSTAFSSSSLPISTRAGSSKSVAQRRSRAPPLVPPELRKAEHDEVEPYLREVKADWERWVHEAASGAQVAEGSKPSYQHVKEEELPSLDGVPQIFFDGDFNLSNPRTFDLVTERIRLSPNTSPQQPSTERFESAGANDSPSKSSTDEPIPGLGPLTLADLAADQILQEKLSHYTAVVESHLVREIGLRSSSFFAALSNLQHLHRQGDDCLAKVSELQAALAPEERGVGSSARKGLAVLRSQARRRGLESVDRGIRAVEDIASGVEGVRELVENGEYMGALEIAEQIESIYYGSSNPPITPNAHGTPPKPINLTRVKALDSLPRKLSQLRAQVAKSLESELVGVLDHETGVAVEEYRRLAPAMRWKGKEKETRPSATANEESGELQARERALERARPVVKGLVRANGLEGAVVAWRESVLRDVRAMVRVHLPTTETPTAEEEDAFAQTSSRASIDLTSVSEKSLSLAKKLRSMSHDTFLLLATQTYLGLLGTVAVIDIHSRVLLELAQESRQVESQRKAPKRPPPPSANGSRSSLLTIPGSPGGAETVSPSSIASVKHSSRSENPQLESALVSDIEDVVHAAAELANLRFSKVIGVRTEVHAQLRLEEFIDIFDASWSFVVQCEIICRRMIVGLRGVMVGQAKTFLQTFHQRKITESAKYVEEEQWTAADVSSSSQKHVDLILQSAVSDPIDLLLAKRREDALASRSEASPANSNGEHSESKKQLDIEGRGYFSVGAGLTAIDVLLEYVKIVLSCPLLTTDAMSKIVEFMKAFNSRTCQVVLGAGAMRSAGLKNITAKHLALASQALSIMISLIPYIRETLRRHLAPKQAVMLIEFDKLKRDYQEHQNEIHSKLVAIMSDRLHVHCRTLEAIDWEVAPSETRKEGLPNTYMESLVKEHLTLHKVLSRFLLDPTVEFIMGQVFSALNSRLAEEYAKVELKSEAARKRMLLDVGYMKGKFAELKGLERKPPGAELEHLIESKQTPLSKRAPTPLRTSTDLSRSSFSSDRTPEPVDAPQRQDDGHPASETPPGPPIVIPTTVQEVVLSTEPETAATIAIASNPRNTTPEESTQALQTPAAIVSHTSSIMPARRKSMAERLAEIARRKPTFNDSQQDSQAKILPTVPQEKGEDDLTAPAAQALSVVDSSEPVAGVPVEQAVEEVPAKVQAVEDATARVPSADLPSVQVEFASISSPSQEDVPAPLHEPRLPDSTVVFESAGESDLVSSPIVEENLSSKLLADGTPPEAVPHEKVPDLNGSAAESTIAPDQSPDGEKTTAGFSTSKVLEKQAQTVEETGDSPIETDLNSSAHTSTSSPTENAATVEPRAAILATPADEGESVFDDEEEGSFL